MTPKTVHHLLGSLPVVFALALGGCGDDGNAVAPPAGALDTVPPATPLNLAVSADLTGTAAINVQWDENSEPDLAGYVLQRSLDRGATWTTLNTAPLATAGYTDSYNSRADYRVAAVDVSDNQSAYSGQEAWIYIRHNGGKNPAKLLEN